MTIVIGYSRKTKEGVREAYIAHDSAITDDNGNRMDMHGISEKFVRKGNSLATGAGSTCYILHKINKLFRAMNLSEKDLETLVREIDKNVMSELDEKERRYIKYNANILLMHNPEIFLWTNEKVMPLIRIRDDSLICIGCGDSIAEGIDANIQYLRSLNWLKKSAFDRLDLKENPVEYLRYIVSATCYVNTNCRPPVWVHHVSDQNIGIITECFDDDKMTSS